MLFLHRKSDEDASESTKKRISVAERIFKMETKSSGAEGDSPRSSTEISTPVKKQSLFRSVDFRIESNFFNAMQTFCTLVKILKSAVDIKK